MTLDLVGRHVAMPMSYSLVCSYIKDYRGVYTVNFVADMDHPNKDCDATADLPTVPLSPYLFRFSGSKYGVPAGLQIIRQRAVSVKTNYYTVTWQTAPLSDA